MASPRSTPDDPPLPSKAVAPNRRALIAAALTVAVLVACSSGGGNNKSSKAPTTTGAPDTGAGAPRVQEYAVPAGSHPHDVAVAIDGSVWYTAQSTGKLGRLDPATGRVDEVALGNGSAPHGVIVGPDGAPWITDGGLNAIVRVDPVTSEVKRYPLPANRPNASLNTAVFDRDGTLWFTGQNGVLGRLDTRSGAMTVSDAPRGPGPYGIAT